MSSTGAMAPNPTSPHASVLQTGGTTTTPSSLSVSRCFSVNTLSHISVFMAGATITGFWKSHARKMHVNRLSASPHASLASEFALSGAIRKTSAQFLKSMCMTGSPFRRHWFHSSLSPSTWIPSMQDVSRFSKKFLAASVTTTWSWKCGFSACTMSSSLIAATLPVIPSSTLGLSSVSSDRRTASLTSSIFDSIAQTVSWNSGSDFEESLQSSCALSASPLGSCLFHVSLSDLREQNFVIFPRSFSIQCALDPLFFPEAAVELPLRFVADADELLPRMFGVALLQGQDGFCTVRMFLHRE
mmetsp:Transcript_11615/g.71432  ORF Transcript_11615/g.71432 Transcript_11615/m.71432 type:complete len:300 (+) Transcript_11615:2280-3179(+)